MFRKIEFIGLHLLIKGWVNLIWAKYRLFLIVFSAELINVWISEVIFNMLSISNRILNFYFFWWLWNQFSVFVLLEFLLTLFCALIFIDKVFSWSYDCGGATVERLHSRFNCCCKFGWNAHRYKMVLWGKHCKLIEVHSFRWSTLHLSNFKVLLLWERRWLICSHLSLATTSLYDLLSRHILLKSNS